GRRLRERSPRDFSSKPSGRSVETLTAGFPWQCGGRQTPGCNGVARPAGCNQSRIKVDKCALYTLTLSHEQPGSDSTSGAGRLETGPDEGESSAIQASRKAGTGHCPPS